MASVSNGINSCLNFIFLILGLVLLSTGVYVHFHGISHCKKLLQQVMWILGVFVTVMSLLGLLGSLSNKISLLTAYLAMIFILVVGILAVTVLAFVITRKGSGIVNNNNNNYAGNPGLGSRESRMEDFTEWAQMYVVDEHHWDQFKRCLIDSQTCKPDIDYNRIRSADPLQLGCCKPPEACNIEYRNVTSSPVDKDCSTWKNEQDVLCFDCISCRGGFLAKLRQDYTMFALYNILIVSVLMASYSIGCCARSSIKHPHASYNPSA